MTITIPMDNNGNFLNQSVVRCSHFISISQNHLIRYLKKCFVSAFGNLSFVLRRSYVYTGVTESLRANTHKLICWAYGQGLSCRGKPLLYVTLVGARHQYASENPIRYSQASKRLLPIHSLGLCLKDCVHCFAYRFHRLLLFSLSSLDM